MRTDYKIGIAVVLFLAAVIVVYNVYVPTQDTQATHASGRLTLDGSASPPQDDTYSPYLDGTSTIRADELLLGTGPGFTTPPPVSDDPTREIAASSDEAAVTLGGDSESTRDDRGSAETAAGPVDAGDEMVVAADGDARGDYPPAELNPPATADVAAATLSRTYIVQAGDKGFWTVSKKMYGNGKHWAVIGRANPTVDPNKLRPGLKLKIPALSQPRRRAASRSSGHGGAGQIVQEGDKRYYYVQKGDAGFWKISEIAYGHGKYWARIDKANPGVDSDNLRVGQKILIPPEAVGGTSHRSIGPGDQWYTVRKGDAGFWDVAENVYGRGMGIHWRRIAHANLQVNSNRLRAGQRLLIPPLSATGSTAGSR